MTPLPRILALLSLCLFPSSAFAAVDPEVTYILNSFLFLVCGVLVMFMAAGFTMLEAGTVRNRSVATIILKNISLYAVAGIVFLLFGYNLMYNGVEGGWYGMAGVWSADDSAALGGDYSAGYASASDWFFQMVFVATTCSIVSGAIAERMKIRPFLIFAVLLAGFIYPVAGSWHWGGGWLAEMGFSDFAGSTIVHSVGGWAALVGCIVLGPRLGRFEEDGTPVPMLPSSAALVGLGVFILWFGWFGFNGGSQLALGSAADAIAISNIFANTNTAAAAGVIAVILLTRLRNGRVDLYASLNGALGGLVAITAEPLMPTLTQAALIGAAGGAVVVFTTPLLERMRIDDVVGAVPVHLFCGILGTLVVPFSNPEASFAIQLKGVAYIGLFTAAVSFIGWKVISAVVGLRLAPEEEERGLDNAELEISGYPYFKETVGMTKA